MANLKTKQFWDNVWTRISTMLNAPVGALESPFDSIPLDIDEPTTFFVETTGNDINNGLFQDRAFRTVQKVIDYLKKFTIKAPVTIKVGAGTFAGFILEGLKFETGGVLIIEGTATVLYTGTIASTSVNNGIVTVTDSGAAFSSDEHKGRILKAVTPFSPTFDNYVYRPVYQNTANTVLCPNWSTVAFASNSTQYQILRLDTKFEMNALQPMAVQIGHYSSGSWGSPDSKQLAPITLSLLEFSTTEAPSGISFYAVTQDSNTDCCLRGCRFLTSHQGIPLLGQNTNESKRGDINSLTTNVDFKTTILGCYFENTVSSGAVWGITVRSNYSLRDNYFRKTQTNGTCWSVLGGAGSVGSTGYTAGNILDGGSVAIGTSAGVNILISRCALVNVTIGVNIINSVNVGLTSCQINTTTGISIQQNGYANVSSCAITATTGITLITGSRAQINSASTITATTELSVEGVTSTLATMRGNSPKIFPTTANVYGSYVYE